MTNNNRILFTLQYNNIRIWLTTYFVCNFIYSRITLYKYCQQNIDKPPDI